MQTTFVNTNDIYHQIIAAPDMATRTQLYHAGFIEPCQTMFQAFGQWQQSDDPLTVARNWNYLMPEDLTAVPPSLSLLETAAAWQTAAAALKTGAERLAAFTDLETVTGWLMLQNPQHADPLVRGAAGAVDFFTYQNFFILYDTPTPENIRALPGMVVHELNHLVRFKAKPWNIQTATVAEYIVVEGLAESFAKACFGSEVLGHYVTDFDERQLDAAKTRIAANLDTAGFNKVRGFIFGDALADRHGFTAAGGMPAFGGYAIGYRVVQAFLEQTGCSIEAATLLDAQQIVTESGYFI